MLKTFLGWLVVFIALSSCSGKTTPAEETARHFMEHYYVQTDLQGALAWTDGLAREKVTKSMKLVEGQAIDTTTRRPKINYKLLNSKVASEEAIYFYEVIIQPPEMAEIHQKTRLTLRKKEDWKVTQFTDYQ